MHRLRCSTRRLEINRAVEMDDSAVCFFAVSQNSSGERSRSPINRIEGASLNVLGSNGAANDNDLVRNA